VFAPRAPAKNRNDEVKLSGALQKITEEDPSLAYEQRAETHELLLKGQGEMHLKVAVEKLAGRYNVAVENGAAAGRLSRDHPGRHQPACALQAPDRRARPVRRHQGRDQALAARLGLPLRRQDRGRRGAAQLHPCGRGRAARIPQGGPLGQPVVDLEATLFDGQYHAVDSSEMSFKMAARIAMTEALPKCSRCCSSRS
jgi:elongation factor G